MIKWIVMAKIYTKSNGRLRMLGEGNVYSKRNVFLKEQDDQVDGINAAASTGDTNINDLRNDARKKFSENPHVTGVSTDVNRLDNSNIDNGGTYEVPESELGNPGIRKNIERLTGDTQVVVTKESRIRNAIPFTKSEMRSLFESIRKR